MQSNSNPTDRFHAERLSELSQRHQDWLDAHGLRTLQGSFYTPFDVVESLIEVAAGKRISEITSTNDAPLVIDPACGTGNFLIIFALRIADRLVANGLDEASAIQFTVRNCVFGTDVDETALRQCAANLSSLTFGAVRPSEIRKHFLLRDSLMVHEFGGPPVAQPSFFDVAPETWADLFPSVFKSDSQGFDVVIGNPPFLNQLSTETASSANQFAELASRYQDSISKLTNTASIFFLAAMRMVKKTGIISFIQPISFLATRDSESVRRCIAETKSLASIWICSEKVFDAAVQVTAITLDLSFVSPKVEIYSERSFNSVGDTRQFSEDEPTWSRAITAARNFPTAVLQSSGVLGDIASITGDFRDQYYGIAEAVVENPTPTATQMKLATVGLIDPGLFSWGKTQTRFNKKPYVFPVVNLDALAPKILDWAQNRRRAKVIVATQTKILECYVDHNGDVLPSVPLSTINSEPEMIWHIAAMISAPPISLIAAERHLGAGMSADVLKLGAPDLLNLPLPMHKDQWDLAALEFQRLQSMALGDERSTSMKKIGKLMCQAYGVNDDSVINWWIGRHPRSLRESNHGFGN